MPCDLDALRIDANDPRRLVRFWAEVLGWTPDGTDLVPTDDTGFRLRFAPNPSPKTTQNRMHVDLQSTSLDDQRAKVERVLALGGRHVDVGQTTEDEHVVLGDPEGNEFCVIEPGNAFLAECGFVGALACDGSQAVGYFWAAALDWPLVWDEGEETAIRAPHGGPKITWGGPPFRPAASSDRVHFDLTANDPDAELARLLSLGAHEVDSVLTDPDGTEFRLLAR